MSGRWHLTPLWPHHRPCCLPEPDVLRYMINKFVFVYLDNTPIFSRSQEEHTHSILAVCLLQKHLYVKAEKFEFHKNTVSFLRFIIYVDNIEMDPAKLQAVQEWPFPKNQKQLHRFLGFAFFFCRLKPAERKYSNRDWELLTIKMALEDGRLAGEKWVPFHCVNWP